jgi:hypothetical protein
VKPILPLVVLLAALSLSAMPYRAPDARMSRSPDRMSMYELAELVTGCPAQILQGIAFAESSFRVNPPHPDAFDRGMFGLHETQALHMERATKWGSYDALIPQEAAMIAAHIYMDNLAKLGDETQAIASYKQGVAGVRRDGVDEGYVERVRRGGRL